MVTTRTLTRVTGQLLLTGLFMCSALWGMAHEKDSAMRPGTDKAHAPYLLPGLSSLSPKPLLLASTPSATLDYDPIRFGLKADKDSVGVGEEVTLTITADLLPISPAMLFFFEEQRGFSLKVLFPRGFVQTGGNYQDGIGDKLSAEGKPHVDYTIRGYFTELDNTTLFTLLRGPREITPNTLFMRKGEVFIYVRTRSVGSVAVSSIVSSATTATVASTMRVGAAREAAVTATSCDILSRVQGLKYSRTAAGVNQVTVILKPGTAAVQYSLNSVAYQVSSTLTPSSTTGVIYMRYAANPYCMDAVPFNFGPYLASLNKADVCPNCTLPTYLNITVSPQAVCSPASRLVTISVLGSSMCASREVTRKLTGVNGGAVETIGKYTCSDPETIILTQDGANTYEYSMICYCTDGSRSTQPVSVTYAELGLSSPDVPIDANGVIRTCNKPAGSTIRLEANNCPTTFITWYKNGAAYWSGVAWSDITVGNNADIYSVDCRYGSGVNTVTCSKSITVISVSPIIITPTNSGLCSNTPATLLATVSGNTSPVSLTWSGPGLPSGFVGTSTTVAQEGAYTVKTQVNGCLYSATTQVTVVSPPNPPTIPGWIGPSTSVVAAGTSLTLIASGCPGTINWYAGNTLTGPSLGLTGNLLPITVNQTQSYYARCVDGQGCSSPASATTTFVVSNTVLYNGQYRGYVDVPSCGIVYGWAANQANPTTPLKVSIFIDNAERSQMYTDWYRQDAVCNICECSACPCPCSNSNLTPYGISWPIPDIYLDGQPHTLGIKIVETGQWLISTTMSMSFSMAKLNTPTIVGPANTTLTANSLLTLSNSGTCAGTTTWYTPVGSVGTGASITLTVNQSQTYFARCVDAKGWSSPTSNSIAITMAGIVITPANSTICSGSPISLTALGCSQSITWIKVIGSLNISYPTTSSVLTTEALTANTTIKAVCGTAANAPVATAMITVGTSTVAFTTTTLCSGSPQRGQLTATVSNPSGPMLYYRYQLEDISGNVKQSWTTNSNAYNYVFTNLSDGKYVVRVQQIISGQATCPASATVSIACDCGLAVSGLPISNSLMVGSLLSLSASMNTPGQLAWNGPTGSQFFVQSPTNTSATSYSATGNLAYLVPNAMGSFTIRVQQPGVATCYKDLSLTVRPYACACTDCNLPTLANTDNLTIADAATITQNFVKEITFLNSVATQFQETISYIDGLGRPMQQVQLGAGGAAYDQSPARYQDIISVQEYDAFGRQPRNYLPYTDDTYGGSFRSGASLTVINNYYNNTLQRAGNAYTGITYEASALSRVLSQTAPGSSTAVTMVYRTNTTTDAVKLLTYVFSNSTISVSTYATNQLLVTETTNENGQKTVEFKDRDGRLVCREVAGLRTYYAFDDLGRLRCVVPPLASSLLNQASFAIFDATNDLVFAYDYDERGRLIRKKIPGAGVTTLGYDLRDRLTSSTDAKATTIVTTYDDFDRVTSTSVANGQLLTQHFYDSYSYAGSKSFDLTHAYSQTALTNSVRGMATGTKVWGLGNASSLTLLTTTYYDGLGRVIQTLANNHLAGVDKSSSKLDFAGRVLETKLSTQNGVIIETRQSYDVASRLKAVCQRVTDNASAAANTAGQYWEPIARNNYNPIGELTRKTLGCSLQNLDYTYQMRGWLTGLNQPTNLAQANDNDLFGMSLGYDGVGNITTWNYRSG